MNKHEDDEPSSERSWLERLLQHFMPEPQDREQLLQLLRSAEQRNVIKPDALGMIEGALQVANMQVRDIMIPRANTVFVTHGQALPELIVTVNQATHSRYPVLSDDGEQVLGIIHAKDLLRYFDQVADTAFDIDDSLRPASIVPESQSLDILLKAFRAKCNHMAVVVDEYGKVSGVVTIEDIIEQIVGDIDDEFDANDDCYIKAHDEGDFIVNAMTPIEEFNQYFKVNFSDDEFDTIGGLVLKQFGHMPKRGETTTLNGFTIEVLHADKRRIRLLRVEGSSLDTRH